MQLSHATFCICSLLRAVGTIGGNYYNLLVVHSGLRTWDVNGSEKPTSNNGCSTCFFLINIGQPADGSLDKDNHRQLTPEMLLVRFLRMEIGISGELTVYLEVTLLMISIIK